MDIFLEWDMLKLIQNYNEMYENYKHFFETSSDEDIKFYSRWMMSRCIRHMTSDKHANKDIEADYLETFKLFPHRAEALFELIECMKEHQDKFKYAMMCANIQKPAASKDQNKWINDAIYDWSALDLVGIHGFYCNKYADAYDACNKLLSERLDKIPPSQIDRIKNNRTFSENVLKEQNSYEIFKSDILKLKTQASSNSIHFIYIYGGHPFVMAHYIAIKSAHDIQKPDNIYLYNDKEPSDTKWWNRVKKYVTIAKITIPKHINGHRIPYPQHQADVMRLNILNNLGGTYMDIDIISLKNLSEFAQSASIVMAEEEGRGLCNCVIMAKSDTKMISCWINRYETEYGNKTHDWWAGLSVVMPGLLAKEFPEEIKILEQNKIMPYLYKDDSIYDITKDTSKDYVDSYTIHLWDTEVFKRNTIPRDTKYFCNRNNTFTRLFKKYVAEYMDEDLKDYGALTIPGYTFYENLDITYNDIKQVPNKTINELKEICDKDTTCVAFNTHGWLKNKLDMLSAIGGHGNTNMNNNYRDGIYIKDS